MEKQSTSSEGTRQGIDTSTFDDSDNDGDNRDENSKKATEPVGKEMLKKRPSSDGDDDRQFTKKSILDDNAG